MSLVKVQFQQIRQLACYLKSDNLTVCLFAMAKLYEYMHCVDNIHQRENVIVCLQRRDSNLVINVESCSCYLQEHVSRGLCCRTFLRQSWI